MADCSFVFDGVPRLPKYRGTASSLLTVLSRFFLPSTAGKKNNSVLQRQVVRFS